MLTCPGCSQPVADGSRFCPACGAAVAQGPQSATGPYDAGSEPPGLAAFEGRATGAHFDAGAVLAGRYRVVSLLGRGGMGEVYRADDLTLGQPVALKFLPAPVARDPDRLTRFRKEVASARKVSHPNVCRVYDIAEHENQPFLSMEFIDGEDLASVLRRFGRLPEERAVEAARQLCAGLAAVHEQGLLHRDLKPANVMLDGRGKVRLTDFGLAAAADDLAATDIRSGTPLYMAPEQLAGKEVSVRSDLFALGLVLYELFTGKRAFAAADRDELARKYAQEVPSKLSSHVSGLSPAVERVILRSLEREPAARPKSAYEVLAALPGGDPLAAALAAGETPSPKLVADAGGEGSIPPRVGAALLGVVVLALVVSFVTAGSTALYRQVPLPRMPAEMDREARKLLNDLGYTDKPADWVGWYGADLPALSDIPQKGPGWDQLVRDGTYPTICYSYREAPRLLAAGLIVDPTGFPGFVSWANPPQVDPGMAGVRLDPQGHLLEMYALPPRRDASEASPSRGDWYIGLFAAAGLDYGQFKDSPARPEWNPPCVCDQRLAWTGAAPNHPDVPLRVEAAAYRGRPVYFQVIGPLARDPYGTGESDSVYVTAFGIGQLAVAALLGVRNLWRRRVDWRGAARLSGSILVAVVGVWLLVGHHNASVDTGFLHNASFDTGFLEFIAVLGFGGFAALLCLLFYVALEPAVRRRWPWQFTAWNRFLDGRWRDPMLGRDLLLGLACGAALWTFDTVANLFCGWAGYPSFLPPAFVSQALTGPLSVCLMMQFTSVLRPLGILIVAFFFSLVLRRDWLTWPAVVAAFVPLLLLIGLHSAESNFASALFAAEIVVGGTAMVLILSRFGLLAGAAFFVAINVQIYFPLTLDTSAWYFWEGFWAAAVLLALAAYGFVTATRGQRLFPAGFLGDD